MEISCNVIRDLLPLYAEDMVSEDSEKLVRDHIARCPACRDNLTAMRVPIEFPPEPNPERLKNLGKRMLQRTILLVMVMIFFVSTMVTWVLAVVSWCSIPVSLEDVQYAIVQEDGKIYVELHYIGTLSWWRDRNADTPSPLGVPDPEVGSDVTCLSVSRTVLDELLGTHTRLETVLIPIRDSFSVWYLEGNEAQCLWGDENLKPQHRWDPIFVTALFAECVFLLIYLLTRRKWLGTVSLFTANLLLADLAVFRGIWLYSSYSGISFAWLMLMFMALLLTCSEVFAYHLWKERNII